MIVYKVTNKINGRVYIGQTRQPLERRWRQHCSPKSNTRGLAGAIAKYGKLSFSLEILGSYVAQEDLDLAEQYFIEYHNCLTPIGYNLTTGGEGGYTRSEETRQLLSSALKQLPPMRHTEASRLKCSVTKLGALNPAYGKKQSEATKQKRSAALKGRPRSPEVREKIRQGHLRRQNADPAGAM